MSSALQLSSRSRAKHCATIGSGVRAQNITSRTCAEVGYTLSVLRVVLILTANHGCFRANRSGVRKKLRGGADDTRTAAGALPVSRYFCTTTRRNRESAHPSTMLRGKPRERTAAERDGIRWRTPYRSLRACAAPRSAAAFLLTFHLLRWYALDWPDSPPWPLSFYLDASADIASAITGLALVSGCLVGHRHLGGGMTKTSHRFGNGSADACGRSSGPRRTREVLASGGTMSGMAQPGESPRPSASGFDARPTAEPFAHCCASQLRIDDIEQAAIRSMAWQSRAVDQFIRSRGRS